MTLPFHQASTNGHHAQVQLPILGQPRRPVFVCRKGHESQGEFRMAVAPTGRPGEMIGSQPMCPVCYAEWLGENFGTVEKQEPETNE
jgi:hypothetical protein